MLLNKPIFTSGLVVLAALMGGLAQPAFAANQDDLKKIEQDIQQEKEKSQKLKAQSESLQKEAEALRAELIALSQSVQQREANVTRLEIEISELGLDEDQARRALEQKHGQTVETLIALQRLALNPPEAIIAMPQEPGDMVRSAILLRSMVPHIQEQATALRIEVDAYAKKRQQLEDQKQRLIQASTNLDDEKRHLALLIEEKKSLSKKYVQDSESAAKQVAALSAKASNLRDLLKNIEDERQKQAERQKQVEREKKEAAKKPDVRILREEEEREIVLGKPPSGKPIKKAKGQLSRPASGPVVMHYGEKEKLGGSHKGITIKTRLGAQIVATYDGQIAFAGPFRGYKQLLIIDHGDGYHTLLTGMERIDVSVGQWLLSGEPVGVMSSNGSTSATLYFELRRKGAPINPLPWMRQQTARARG